MRMLTCRVFRLAGLSVLLLMLPGCIFLPGDHEEHSRGVKLSEAMESSASGSTRDLGGGSSYHHHSEDNSRSYSSDDTDYGGFSIVSYDEGEYFWQVPADVGYSASFNSDIRRLTQFTLTPVAVEDERNYLGLYFGGGTVELESGSLPDLATDDVWTFDVGFTYRRYLNSSQTGLSPYFTGSIGFELLSWQYRSPITAGGDTIKGDSLGAGRGSVGFGVSTRRDSHLSFFGEVGVGATGFAETTAEGFENDVFDSFGFFTAKVGLSLKF